MRGWLTAEPGRRRPDRRARRRRHAPRAALQRRRGVRRPLPVRADQPLVRAGVRVRRAADVEAGSGDLPARLPRARNSTGRARLRGQQGGERPGRRIDRRDGARVHDGRGTPRLPRPPSPTTPRSPNDLHAVLPDRGGRAHPAQPAVDRPHVPVLRRGRGRRAHRVASRAPRLARPRRRRSRLHRGHRGEPRGPHLPAGHRHLERAAGRRMVPDRRLRPRRRHRDRRAARARRPQGVDVLAVRRRLRHRPGRRRRMAHRRPVRGRVPRLRRAGRRSTPTGS